MRTSEERLPILGGFLAQGKYDSIDSYSTVATSSTTYTTNSTVPRTMDSDTATTGTGRGNNKTGVGVDTEKGPVDVSSGQEPEAKLSFLSLPSRKKWTLVLLSFANTAACTCFSLLAPFFPAEAAEKGMSETVIGLVFSVYALCIFLSSPIYGNYITHIGPRFAFVAGQFLAGGCSILFGTLYMVPSGAPFTILAFILRCMMALSASAFATASFTLIANEFPDRIAVVFAILEVFTGLGYTVGPLFGGVLYDLGGFGLPFYSSGVFLITCCLTSFLFLPARSDYQQQKRQGSVVSLLASPLVVVSCFTVISGTYTFGFLESSIAIHLQQFHVSASTIGSIFMVVAFLYSTTSPIYGWLSDKKNITYPLLTVGSLVVCVSLLLIGPSPLLPFLKPQLGLVVFALVLMGAGEGAINIPVIKGFYIGARRLGFQDGLELDGLVSGLLTSSVYLGSFLGPTIGSAVMQATSYEWSSTMNAGFHVMVFFLLIAYKGIEKSCLKYDDDTKFTRPSADSSQITTPPFSDSYRTESDHNTPPTPTSRNLSNSAYEEDKF